MQLFTLKRFETYTYSTHIVFIASSLDKAEELCYLFYDEHYDLYHGHLKAEAERDEFYEEHGNYDCDELNHRCWDFLVKLKASPILFQTFGFNDGRNREELVTEWISEIQTIEGDSIFMVSDTDGD